MRTIKDVVISVGLSIVVPGGGQIYNKQVDKGLKFGLIFVFLYYVTNYIPLFHPTVNAILFVVILLIYYPLRLYLVFDAWRFLPDRHTVEKVKWKFCLLFAFLLYVPTLTAVTIGFPNVYKNYRIPSGNMAPAIIGGDYIQVKRFYFNQYIEYGDIIGFKLPTDPKINYIMRVVGLPGDKVQMVNGFLHLNGKAVKRRNAGKFVYNSLGEPREIPRYIETLPNGKRYFILEEAGYGRADNTQVYTVPEQHVFVLGDNRDRSQDSRFLNAVGYIPLENIFGKAAYIYWHGPRLKQFWRFGDYDFSRIGAFEAPTEQ